MRIDVLICVLDWGLGHATRMVPVIDVILSESMRVGIASSGNALNYLRMRYPEVPAIRMPERPVSYGVRGAMGGIIRRGLAQPWINHLQHNFIKSLVRDTGAQAIISDNVYGAWSTQVPSVLVTHQLRVLSPLHSSFVNRRLAKWLNRFTEVWIPDIEGSHSMAGMLSVNDYFKGNTHYIGLLSRLNAAPAVAKQYAYTALLSGVEPQRSIFEKRLLDLMNSLQEPCLLIRGIQKNHKGAIFSESDVPNHIEVLPFMDDIALVSSLQSSELVIARSGYSSLCDLAVLGCKALVVPTPGQPEQEYLARRVSEMGWCAKVRQDALQSYVLKDERQSKACFPDSVVSDFKLFFQSFAERHRIRPYSG